MGDMASMRHVAAREQGDDVRFVAVRVAGLAIAQPDDVLVTDPRAAGPSCFRNEVPGHRQTGGTQRPPEQRLGRRRAGGRCRSVVYIRSLAQIDATIELRVVSRDDRRVCTLEALDYVTRQSDSADARRKNLTVTPKGRDAIRIGAAAFDRIFLRWRDETGAASARAIEALQRLATTP